MNIHLAAFCSRTLFIYNPNINSMPKLLYTWYLKKFTASVTSSGHSALRHEVSRICTILYIDLKKVGHFLITIQTFFKLITGFVCSHYSHKSNNWFWFCNQQDSFTNMIAEGI